MQAENENRRVHFTEDDDLHLLREVVGQNPYEDNRRWNVIQINMLQIVGKFISERTMRERVKNLTKKYLEKSRTRQFQSGIEEEITEYDDLLRIIVEMQENLKLKKKQNKKNTKNENPHQKGIEVRERAMKRISEPTTITCQELENETSICNEVEIVEERIEYNEGEEQRKEKNEEPLISLGKENEGCNRKNKSNRNILVPTRKRSGNSLKQNTLAYLAKKNERHYEIRSRELALQEREMALRENKMDLENFERRKKFEMDQKRLEMELSIFKNQQKLLEMAFQRNV